MQEDTFLSCECLFKAPDYTNVQLSNDGGRVFFTRNEHGENYIFCYNWLSKTEEKLFQIGKAMKLITMLDFGLFYYLEEIDGRLSALVICLQGEKRLLTYAKCNIKVLNYSSVNNTLVYAVTRGESSVYDLYRCKIDAAEESEKIYDNVDSYYSRNN